MGISGTVAYLSSVETSETCQRIETSETCQRIETSETCQRIETSETCQRISSTPEEMQPELQSDEIDDTDKDPDNITETETSECSSVEYQQQLPGLEDAFDIAETRIDLSSVASDIGISQTDVQERPGPSTSSSCDKQEPRRHAFKNITVPYTEKGKRMYRKADFCKYCERMYSSKISKHYLNCHMKETKVKEILSLPLGSKERQRKMLLLQNEGNHTHNTQVLMSGRGELVVSRRPTSKEETDASHFLPCTNCLGWFHSRNLQLHAKTCPAGMLHDKNHLRNARTLITPFLASQESELNKLFSLMKETKKYPGLKRISEDDFLICEFAKGLLKKLGTKEEQRLKDMDNIRTKIRHIARLLKAMKERETEIKDLESAITPKFFFLVVETVKHLSVECDSPKFATTLGHYLKQLSILKKSLALIAGDEDKHKQASDFDTLFDAHWNSHVSSVANRGLKLRTLNKDIKIPPTSDLVALKDFLEDEIKQYLSKFPLSGEEWTRMAMMLLVRITLFNKSQISEVAELKVKDYTNRIRSSSVDEDILKQLEFTEKVLVRRIDLIEVRGKSTRGQRKVFIILTQEMIKACDHLLETKIHAGLDPENHFFFSRQNSLGPIDGCKAMREVTNICERVKEPKLIRSRLLRKYLATTIQILDMSTDELSAVVDHMGHSVAVHTDVYGIQTSLLEKTKVARALIALENGQMSRFTGEPLSSITLDQLPLPILYDGEEEMDAENVAVTEHTEDNAGEESDQASEEFDPPVMPDDAVSSRRNVPKRIQHKRWGKSEEEILFKAFKKCFEQSKNPRYNEIISAQKRYPLLQGRSVPVIKTCEEPRLNNGSPNLQEICGQGYFQELQQQCNVTGPDQVNSSKKLTFSLRICSKEKKHRCQLCNRGFSRKYDMWNHMRKHSGERPFECDVCFKRFTWSGSLVVHKRIHSGEKPYVCEICCKRFVSSNGLKSHEITHAAEKPYPCDECGKVFARINTLRVHKKWHSGVRPHRCDECGKTYIMRGRLNEHKRKHAEEKPFPCDLCDKAYSRLSDLVGHKRIHTGERPYKCNVCQKAFMLLSNLIGHKKMHTGERPYKCDMCDKTYTSSSNLIEHKRSHTGERPYNCDLCSQTFARKSCFDCHKKSHWPVKEKLYKCDICDKMFAWRRSLSLHKKIHAGVKSYSCDVCGKSFISNNALYQHRKIHLSDRPHKCDVCGRGFLRLRDLETHKRTHTGERPFKCDQCEKSFCGRNLLQMHQKYHLDEGQYKCDVCGQIFVTMGNLNRHKRIHTQERAYVCDMCTKTFTTFSNRNRHRKRIHLVS
ncbi:Zinc finger protein 271 [Plakobranchus ocellatus]|uniref:Zinc finger protein 271 n=1 Tax=Plakobranchus ocellatus TaxID=259542 RepID=A0AAV3YJ69_9GAST|nr:Zinc finger protein 271 [Plakobranchus ocellatus]